MGQLMNWYQSRICGWDKIIERFPFEGDFNGKKFYFQSVSISMAQALLMTIGANESGLYLSAPFSLGFTRPVLIPWSKISFNNVSERWLVIGPRNLQLNID